MKRIVQSIALAVALAVASVPMFASNGNVATFRRIWRPRFAINW